ncbi:uncharacterized protein [Cardiocondyla obscurior]|uniref:uncharacterized protein isoform X2 n=1 Tax=Cardiocondyla obscurior TaxID=286306 RepID=UPI003965780D
MYVQQLRKYWSNLKKQSKNILTLERQSTFLTGGGPYEKKNQVDSDVLDIIPDLMTTAPTLSFCNISTQQAVEQQREVLKAIQLNCNPTFVMNTASKIRENLETELSEVIYVENTESRPSSQSVLLVCSRVYAEFRKIDCSRSYPNNMDNNFKYV